MELTMLLLSRSLPPTALTAIGTALDSFEASAAKPDVADLRMLPLVSALLC